MLTRKFLCKIFVLNAFVVLFLYFVVMKTFDIRFLKDSTMYKDFSKLSVINSTTTDDYRTTTINYNSSSLPLCPEQPPDLVGHINVSLSPIPTFQNLETELNWVQPGGHYSPPCQKNQTIAIIIPYRQRHNQLLLFLKNMHPYFRKKQLNYTIFLVEQNDTLPFNRGTLMNIGFVEALNLYNFSCFIFHDVDLFPENDRNMYECIDTPLHLISSLNKWNYTLPYKDLFGGVVLLKTETFKYINGFSNKFWGWGGEDDDLLKRVLHFGLNFIRPDNETGRYTMVKHQTERPNPIRFTLIETNSIFYKVDGLSNLNYELEGVFRYYLYTKIVVKLSKTVSDYDLE